MNAHWGERSMTEVGQLLKLVNYLGIHIVTNICEDFT